MESGGEAKAKPVLRFLKGYIQATAALFAMIGLVMLLIALDDVPPLRQRDALFGLTTRTVLVLAGVLHLTLSGYLFAARDLMNQGMVALWAGLNHLAYALGMAWVKAAAPLPAVVLVGWKLGIRPQVVGICWNLFIAYLALGSLLILRLEWRRLKQLEAAAFLKRWHAMREQGNAPQKAK